MRTTPESPLGPRMRATARRSVVGHDLQLDVDALPGAHHAEQAADGVGDAPVATDHAAHVSLVDGQCQLDLVSALLDGHPHALRVVDERAGHVVQEVLHADALPSLSEPASDGGASDDAWDEGSSADALGAESSSAAGFGSVRAAALARAAGRDALLAGVRRGLGFAASSVASAFASSPTCRSRRTTVSDGWAPLLIQVRTPSASIFTVAGSVSGS